MFRRNVRGLVCALCAFVIGCASGNDPINPQQPGQPGGSVTPGTATPGTPGTNPGDPTQPGTPGVTPSTPGTGGGAVPCACALDQVCANNACIARPAESPGDVVAELVLLNQVREGDTTATANLGKAEASLWDAQPLPIDTRTTFPTANGRCFLETGTMYPHYFNDVSWPAGPRRGAGDLTFKVAEAPAGGAIVLEEMCFDKPGEPDPSGYSYFHGETPPKLRDGAVTYSDFFDTDFVALGSPFEVQNAGGEHVAAQTFGGGQMARLFAITSPPDYRATQAKITVNQGLAVTWSPAQPDAVMEIFIVSDAGGGYATLLSCLVTDDGATQIPAEALTSFYGETSIQLRRSATRYQAATTKSGKTLHTYLIGRHARLRAFFINP